jgi:hypothetical protein
MGQAKVASQVMQIESVGAGALALMGLDATSATALLPVAEHHTLWWLPLFFLVPSLVACVGALATNEVTLGLSIDAFYELASENDALSAHVVLLNSLVNASESNVRVLSPMRRLLSIAALLFFSGAVSFGIALST